MCCGTNPIIHLIHFSYCFSDNYIKFHLWLTDLEHFICLKCKHKLDSRWHKHIKVGSIYFQVSMCLVLKGFLVSEHAHYDLCPKGLTTNPLSPLHAPRLWWRYNSTKLPQSTERLAWLNPSFHLVMHQSKICFIQCNVYKRTHLKVFIYLHDSNTLC